MLISEIFKPDNIKIGVESEDKDELFEEMVNFLADAEHLDNRDAILEGLWRREKKMSTGIAPNIAIPHTHVPNLNNTIGVLGISTNGIDDPIENLSFDIAESGTEYANNLLVANVAATDVSTTNNYFFGQVGGNYVFTLLSGDTYTLPGHKAYLNLSGTSARLSINWGSDDSTGLNELSNENVKLNDGKYYQNGAVVIVRNGIKYNVAGQTIK